MDDFDDLFSINSNPTAEPKDDTDLSGMDVESAQEYVLGFITSLKQLQKQMAEQGQELKTWQDRVVFARERNRTDLIAGAEQRVREIQDKLTGLQAEEQELALKVKEMLQNLKKLKAGFTFSIDADKLLAELTMIVGEKDEVAEKFKEEETLSELEKLKAKIKAEEGNSSGT